MRDDAALLRLAALAGIETRYRDAWGEERTVAIDVIKALIAAMGVDAAAAEAAAQEAPFCPPVIVAPADQDAITLTLALPAQGTLEWRMTHEQAPGHQGAARIAELPRNGAGCSLQLPIVPAGYGALHLSCGGRECQADLIVAPTRCYLPPELRESRRAWGLTAQLYALRSPRNWGIGDFSDLARLGSGAGALGARALGLNPLHALFAAEPRHISPYSPSSRLFLNALYIDVTAVPEFADCAAARSYAALPQTRNAVAAARRAGLVDHAAVAKLKCAAFALLYRCFRERHLGPSPGDAQSARGAAFRAFQREGGPALRRFAAFEALHEFSLAAQHGFGWRQWQSGLRDPRSREVEAFLAAHSDRVEYFEYLQWEADRQLGEAARAARASGLAIGLYRDLAVGVDPSGADAWSDQELLVPEATVGAPPDPLSLKGQNWGLTPFNPMVLRRRGYAPFIAALRANMRHAGVLRFDHVMALRRLYWVPQGAKASEGAYVSYPFADLVRVLALESERCRCAVIGEDLGTMPEGLRDDLRRADILSCRVLLFEREAGGGFAPPERYPELAAASIATHDLATLRGFWSGRDIEWRRRLDLYATPEQRTRDEAEREADRQRLLDALMRAGLLPDDARDGGGGEIARAVSEAAHRFLGRSAARLVLIQLEDILGEIEQVNLPGTCDEHPNWRRKLPVTVGDILGDERLRELAQALAEFRA